MIELVEICIEPGPISGKSSFVLPGQLALTACARPVAASAPPRLEPQAGTQMWSSLDGHLLGLIMTHLEEAQSLAAAHMVSREWRNAARLATRVLAFRGAVPPDFARVQAAFPHVSAVRMSSMHVKTQALTSIAGLGVTKLQFRACRLEPGCVSLLQRLPLQELELVDVLGPTPTELDDALRGMVHLHHLHVESCSSASRTPALRSLAFLPRIRHLAVKNAWPHHDEVEGLTNLQTLQLEVLCLTRAGVTDDILSSLSRMTALRQLHVPASLVTNLEALATLTTLQDLDVSCPRPQPHDPINNAEHLALLCNLTSLSLAGRASISTSGLAFLKDVTCLSHLDLSHVNLSAGDPSFLWELKQLTCLRIGNSQMPASHFAGISRLVHLVELDVSTTQFDDAGCLALASATGLRNVNLAHSLVTGAGIAMLNASHAGTLQHLRLEGCHVSMWAVSQLLRRQSRHLCLWDQKRRGHLPRVFNVLNQLLVCPLADGGRALRLNHAPEATWLQQGLMLGLVAGIFLGQALLLVLTTVLLLLSPAIIFGSAFCLLLLHVAGATANLGGISMLSTYFVGRAEVWLSAVLVGIHCVHVPPPPPPTTLYS